ncbi:MAG: 3-isopropylmalate dehydrogenase, partial [Blastocatellia bacterium]|nr:3-isopropylmalate dehydrogenase [Blastocatellia bacterium]
GQRVALNTLVYDEHEITRIAHIAFKLARKRKKKLTSVDKANVLETSQLWRDVVNETAIAYPDVTVEHIYVDNCAMQLMLRPETFDVILTENMFGDILSDEAAVLTGSLGMLPSASLNESRGLYEPVHGSAPDIAGKSVANPVGAILSVAMMLRHSFSLEQEASLIEEAVKNVIEAGVRTADIADKQSVSTMEFGQQVCSQIKKEIEQLNVVTV